MSQVSRNQYFFYLFLFSADKLYFCYIGLIVSQDIGKKKLIDRKVVIGVFKYFLSKKRINYLNCKTISQSF